MHVTVLSPKIRTTSETSGDINVWQNHIAAHVVVDHPNVGGGITVVVFGKDPTSGFRYPLLSSNIVASGHTLMKIGPDYTAGANIAKEYIPYRLSVDVVASGTNYYSIGASII